jgi:hypothetical protein
MMYLFASYSSVSLKAYYRHPNVSAGVPATKPKKKERIDKGSEFLQVDLIRDLNPYNNQKLQ